MKIKDISEEWEDAKLHCDWILGDYPEDWIGWKDIRAYGYDLVRIGDKVYNYSKYGLLDEVIIE